MPTAPLPTPCNRTASPLLDSGPSCSLTPSVSLQQGNQLLVRVDEDYIEDAFNLYGLNKVIPNFRDTLRLLLTTAEVRFPLYSGCPD